ncbi:MAG TPA: WD40 repeat domain-containing protein, partial [Roseiflexaceae bacterium]|nr:WD40 repeat domain-containing protein [Roseiflexaceae bacterium]
QLVACYSGNPLALKLVAATIRNLFAGNVHGFLGDETPLFDDIRDVLDEQFGRLSALERELLVWLAIERESVALAALQADLVLREPLHVMVEALRSLQRRSLLECTGDTFTLQHVVMEYTTDRLITQIVREIETGRFDMFARYALLKAQSPEYVRQAQQRLILLPIVKRLVARLGWESVVAQLRALPDVLRARPEFGHSYAAGNLLNMLIALQADVRGLNLEHLAVRQVFARGVLLPQVRMANADLTGSVFTDAFHSIHAVAWSPDGMRIATGASDGSVFVWRAADGVLLESYQVSNGFIWTLDWSRDGELLACGGSDATVTVWSMRRHARVQALSGHGAWINEVAFSPDGAALASCGGDQIVRVWDVAGTSLLHEWAGHTGIVECLAWSPDGMQLASGAVDGTVRVWERATGKLRCTLAGRLSRPSCLSWSADGRWLAGTGLNQPVAVWPVSNGVANDVASIMLDGLASVGELVWHPLEAQLAVAGSDQSLRIVDVTSRRTLVTIAHDEVAGNLAWNPNGTTLAVPYANSSVHIWDSRSGRDVMVLTGYTSWIYSVSWSPDSSLIAAATHARQIQVWEVATRRLQQVMVGH